MNQPRDKKGRFTKKSLPKPEFVYLYKVNTLEVFVGLFTEEQALEYMKTQGGTYAIKESK